MTGGTVGVNESGQRVGESHPHAKHTDREIELLRTMREEHGLRYVDLARIFEMSKGAVAKICQGKRRNQHAVRLVVVERR